MEHIYNDNTYLEHNPTWHEEDSPWKAKHVHDILATNGIIPKTICEIGCGAGEILNQLYNAFLPETTLFGYEISEVAHKICLTKTKSRLEYYLADPLADNSKHFDLAMAIDLFEHLDDYIGFLKKFKSLGEYKIFHIPLELSVQSVLRSKPLLASRKQLGHLHFFTKDLVLDSLKVAGYEIIDSKYTNAAFDLPKKLRTRILNVPRRLFFKISPDLCSRVFGGFSLMVLAK